MLRVSYNWLKEYIDLTISAAELADRLTMAGIEVDSLENFRDDLPRVVVGRIDTVEPLAGSDKLTLVGVDAGGPLLKVVCGAPNVAPGQLVPVALPGAVLPGGRRIEKVRIFGVESEGMLCSAAELDLELPDAEAGLLILEGTIAPGTPVAPLLGFDDPILTLALTPNRADCLGMLGVAYEVAALTGGVMHLPPGEPPEGEEPVESAAAVTVRDPDLCPRFTARVIRDVTVKSSPLWMQLRLLKAGIRPINNIVDVTNYVMWEYGQPLHAYDYRLVAGGEIIVRRAAAGERLVTLDGVERILDENVLVIADHSGPIGLAGVMGGENTEIKPDTTAVLLEAARFHPVSIRRTARRYSLPSEASQRFERGINPAGTLAAQNRAAYLISRLAGGVVLSGVLDFNPDPPLPRRIVVRPHRINEILGVKIAESEVSAILERLGCTVEPGGGRTLEVTVPLRRGDLNIEEDVVEEVARIYGYENIPMTLPRGELLECRESPAQRLLALAHETLTGCGFFEVISYSFINPDDLDRLGLPADDPLRRVIPIQNPLNEDQAIMRSTLLPGLLKVIAHNFNYRETNQLLYEIGAVFIPRALPLDELPDEKLRLALAVTGSAPDPHWLTPSQQADFYLVKGALEALCERFRLGSLEYIPGGPPFLHPSRCAVIRLDGAAAGFLGELHPDAAEAWGFRQPVTVAEIDLELLLARANVVPRVVPLARYPAALRDLAILAPVELPHGVLRQAISEAGGALLERISLFDLYTGEQVPAGKRSLAFSIALRRPGGTLTEAEVNNVMERIEGALVRLGAEIRRNQ